MRGKLCNVSASDCHVRLDAVCNKQCTVAKIHVPGFFVCFGNSVTCDFTGKSQAILYCFYRLQSASSSPAVCYTSML